MKSIVDLPKRTLLFHKKDNSYYRVLYSDVKSDDLYLFHFRSDKIKTELTVRFSYSEFIEDIKRNEFTVVSSDPFIPVVVDEQISTSSKKLRDRAWDQIKCLVDSEPDIYVPEIRNQLINDLERKGYASKPSIYKWLKKYWQCGMIPNALIPNFSSCGPPGVEKSNCSLSSEMKGIIRKGFGKYYLTDGNTLRDARKNTLRTYFNPQRHGNKGFTLDQFVYWGKKGFTSSEIVEKRLGKRFYRTNKRLLHGRASDIAEGPGSLFQIDWTSRDIHVVATHDRQQYVGKPILYGVIDTTSRAIAGVLLTFENPSYITICNALYNTGRDKVEFARECGLEIGQEDWPIDFLPNRVISDRGELLSSKAESIVNNLNVTIDTTSAYRPDLKAIVEKLMDTIQQRVVRLFQNSGKVIKKSAKGLSKDSRKEARVTLNELYRITIQCAIEYNNHHWIDDYPLTLEMSKDKVKKIPIEILRWGFENGLGVANKWDKKSLWLNLLPQKKITPSKKGIRINKQDYVPIGKADFELLNDIIETSRNKAVTISYDPRIYSEVFWIYHNRFIPLRLRGKGDALYSNEWDVVATNDSYEKMRRDIISKEEEIQIKNDKEFEKLIENTARVKKVIVKNAKRAKKTEVHLERKKIRTYSIAEHKSPDRATKLSEYSKPSYFTELKQLDDL